MTTVESNQHISVALAQMDVVWADPDKNLQHVRGRVAEAAAAGAGLIVLPELWGSGYDLAHAAKYATPVSAGLFAEMATMAKRHQMSVAGSLLEEDAGHIYNTHVLFTPEGLAGRYRKMHLFRLMQEHQYLAPGCEPAVCEDVAWESTGLATCYDLRFPELFRGYALAGARLVIVPAQWPTPRIDHWRTLLRARAIENQCFVAGCNRIGSDPDNLFGGASAIVGPWGEVLVEGDTDPALLLAEIDLDKVDEARRRIPILLDRRAECYML
jgi:omega-amidase